MIEQIKSCNDELANKLASIEQNIFGTCWSPEILKEKINKGEFLYWIFNINNNIVGYLGIQKSLDELQILGIGILEEYRNTGLAKKLTVELIKFFKISYQNKVILEVRESNIAAINLYKSVGFSQYGNRENYYKNEDAILFELEKAYV